MYLKSRSPVNLLHHAAVDESESSDLSLGPSDDGTDARQRFILEISVRDVESLEADRATGSESSRHTIGKQAVRRNMVYACGMVSVPAGESGRSVRGFNI